MAFWKPIYTVQFLKTRHFGEIAKLLLSDNMPFAENGHCSNRPNATQYFGFKKRIKPSTERRPDSLNCSKQVHKRQSGAKVAPFGRGGGRGERVHYCPVVM